MKRLRTSAIFRLRHLTLFPFLLPVFFVLHISRHYFGGIPALSALAVTAVYVLSAGIIYLLFRRISKDSMPAGVGSLLLVALLLYWGELIRAIGSLLHLTDNYNYHALILLLSLALIGLFVLLSRRLRQESAEGLRYYLNTLFIIFVVLESAMLGFSAIQSSFRQPFIVSRPEERPIDNAARKGGNIYLLLFDEYASGEVLKNYWGFDNSGIDSFLSSKGFFMNRKSRSNYCWTQFSMASLLNMDYFSYYQQALNYCPRNATPQCYVAMEHARVADVLKKAGYDILTHSLFEVGGQPKESLPTLMASKWELITYNTFLTTFTRGYLPYFLHRREIRSNPNYRFPAFYRIDDYNIDGANMVMNEARHHSAPKFVYAHFMMPHHPYFYDSLDHEMLMDKIKSITPQEEPAYYRYNVRHTNNVLMRMTDSIIKYDPQAAIVVLGDHGYRYHLYEDYRYPEYFQNMSAIYFPDRNYASLPDSFSNVNVFRIVLNKMCGTRYPLLKDKTCALRDKGD